MGNTQRETKHVRPGSRLWDSGCDQSRYKCFEAFDGLIKKKEFYKLTN